MKTLKNLREKFEDVMYAITFAEAGEFETARETMRKKALQGQKAGAKAEKTCQPHVSIDRATDSLMTGGIRAWKNIIDNHLFQGVVVDYLLSESIKTDGPPGIVGTIKCANL